MLPESTLTLLLLASLLGLGESGSTAFWRGVADPEAHALHVDRNEAMRALASKQVDTAEAASLRVIERSPDAFEGHLLLGFARELRQADEAAASFERALALEARWSLDPIAADYASRAFLRVERFTRAAELACRAARRIEPSPLRDALFERCGAAELATGPDALERALTTLEGGLPAEPSLGYLLTLALAYERADAHTLAMRVLSEQTRGMLSAQTHEALIGRRQDALMALGLVLEASGRAPEARALYAQAAEAEGPWRASAERAHARVSPPPRSSREGR